jgi:hypothetical protein
MNMMSLPKKGKSTASERIEFPEESFLSLSDLGDLSGKKSFKALLMPLMIRNSWHWQGLQRPNQHDILP